MLQGQENFIVINFYTISDINTLVEWLHAVHKMTRGSYHALKEAIGRRQKDHLRSIFGMQGLDLDAPDVIHLANRSIYDLADTSFSICHSDGSIAVTAHQKLVPYQWKVCKHTSNQLSDDLLLFLIPIVISLDNAIRLCHRSHKAHENLIVSGLEGIKTATAGGNCLYWIEHFLAVCGNLVDFDNTVHHASIDKEVFVWQ